MEYIKSKLNTQNCQVKINMKMIFEREKQQKLQSLVAMCIPEFLNSGCKCWTLDFGHWTLDTGLWMLDSGLRTLGFGRWTLDCGHQNFKILNYPKL